MSPQFVAPYVKSNKNDVNDADGIAEASARPTMRFVEVKSVAQGHIQQLHRARQMVVLNRTGQCNQIHGFLLEYGIESPKGVRAVLRRLAEVLEDAENELPTEARALLRNLEELRRQDERVRLFDWQLAATAQRLEACQRAHGDPGDRVADGHSAGGGGGRRRGVPQRPGDGGMAGAGAAAALDGRPAAALGHQRARRPVPADASDPRGAVLATLRVEEDGRKKPLGAGHRATPGAEHCGGGPGKQERADRVGTTRARGGVRHPVC